MSNGVSLSTKNFHSAKPILLILKYFYFFINHLKPVIVTATSKKNKTVCTMSWAMPSPKKWSLCACALTLKINAKQYVKNFTIISNICLMLNRYSVESTQYNVYKIYSVNSNNRFCACVCPKGTNLVAAAI